MKNATVTTTCIVGFILLLCNCIGVPDINIPHTKPTPAPTGEPEKEPIDVDISIEKGKILDFSMNGLKLGFSITISNKNTYALVLKDVNYKIEIEENTINNIEDEKHDLTIPAGETESMEKTFTVDFVNLAKGTISFADKKSLAFRVAGDCTIQGKKETVQKTIELAGTIPVPRMPSISLSEAGPGSLDICGFTYNVRIKIENPNPFWIEIKGFNYTLLVKKNSLLKITNNTPQRIEAQSSSFIDIPLVITFTDVIKVTTDLFSQEALNFTFQGEVLYDSFIGNEKAPFKIDDAISLPALPAVSITGIKPVIAFPPKLTITMETHNPNDFDINITKFEFRISISGSEILSGRKQNIMLNAGKTNRISLDAEINTSMLNSLTGKSSANYRVEGLFEFTSILGTLSIPFAFSDSSGIVK